MSGQEIFDLALGLLPAGRAEDYAAKAPGFLSLLCAESLPFENALREFENDPARPVLAEAPVIEALEDMVPWAAALCAPGLVWGLAGLLSAEDEEDARAAELRNRYVTALYEAVRIAEGRVVDLY